jgi:hypothetical protein
MIGATLTAIVLASCSMSGSDGATVNQPLLPSATALPASVSAEPVYAEPTRPAHAPGCKRNQVRVSVMGAQVNGSFQGSIVFQAVDGVTCSLVGYPDVSIVTKSGTGVGAKAAVTVASRAAASSAANRGIVIGRFFSATAALAWSATPAAASPGCPSVIGLRVTAPGTHMSVQPALQATGGGQVDTQLCGAPTVGFVTAGK